MFETVGEVADVCDEEGIDCDLVVGGSLDVARIRAGAGAAARAAATGSGRGASARRTGASSARRSSTASASTAPAAASSRRTARASTPPSSSRGLAAAVERIGVEIYEDTPVRRVARAPPSHAATATCRRGGWCARPRATRTRSTPRRLDPDELVDDRHRAAGVDAGRWRDGRRCATPPTPSATSSAPRTAASPSAAAACRTATARRTDRNGEIAAATVNELARAARRRCSASPRRRSTTHAWAGVLGVVARLVPGRDRGRRAWLTAGGYVGDGVSTANLAGRTLRDLILGEDTELTRAAVGAAPLARTGSPSRCASPASAPSTALYRAADAMEERTQPAVPARRSGGPDRGPLSQRLEASIISGYADRRLAAGAASDGSGTPRPQRWTHEHCRHRNPRRAVTPTASLALPANRRGGARARPSRRCSALAALVYLAGLGRSSLFIDEIVQLERVAPRPRRRSARRCSGAEVTPPLYYVLLHAWTRRSPARSRECDAAAAVARSPASASSPPSIWLGTVVADRRAGLIAGLLAALSPLVLQYAQEVRAYIFVMLAVTIAAAAADPAHAGARAPPLARRSRSPRRAVAVLLHYTAVLVLAPLAVWLLRQPRVSPAQRLAVGAAFALPLLALLPLLPIQLGAGHHDATARRLRADHPDRPAARWSPRPSTAAPLDGMMLTYELGFLALVDAVALLAFADRFRRLRTRWLLVGACVAPAGGDRRRQRALQADRADPLHGRRGAVHARRDRASSSCACRARSAWRCWRSRWSAGVIGVVAAQTPRGQWPDVRTAMADDGRPAGEPGDVVVGLNNVAFDDAMSDYYDASCRRRAAAAGVLPDASDAMRRPRPRSARSPTATRVFVVSSPPVDPTRAARAGRRRRRRRSSATSASSAASTPCRSTWSRRSE